MNRQKLFLLDFDGVVVDGMNEYWHSSLLACEKFLNSPDILFDQALYKRVSKTFIEMRPWVKYGWEMIVIVHEIIKNENPLTCKNKKDFLNKYQQNCQKVLTFNSWTAEDLQRCLDDSRKYQINKDIDKWIKLHIPFYEVLEFINLTKSQNIKCGIITTKGRVFASKILEKLNIIPDLIFGYESGSKVEITSLIKNEYEVLGFIEDRRKTLSDIKKSDKTKDIPCYLADWGYLKETDSINLPTGIELVNLRNLRNLLAI